MGSLLQQSNFLSHLFGLSCICRHSANLQSEKRVMPISFVQVLFPLLSKLMENVSPHDPVGMEETRMRGATLLCKVSTVSLHPPNVKLLIPP